MPTITAIRQTQAELLRRFGTMVAQNITRPDVVGSRPIRLQIEHGSSITAIPGPRVGALEILAGVDAGRLLKVLSANDCALLRQLVPWDFTHDPSVYISGRRVRAEVAWPDHLQIRDIPLHSLGLCPERPDRFITGINERGSTVRLTLSNNNPHILIGGATGSGKSWAMRSIAAQLARDNNQLVLIDGKWGEGLGPVNGLKGQVGPLAMETEEVRGALGWAYGEMKNRYQRMAQGEIDVDPVVVVFDEFQEFTRGESDPAIIELMRRLGAQGRAANVHLVTGTQHATVDVFGDRTTRRHFTARIALRVTDYSASEAVVGAPNPRADINLLGAGDAYVISPSAIQRVQMAYIPQHKFRGYLGGQPMLDQWPLFDAKDLGSQPQGGRPRKEHTPEEWALAILAAREGIGRDKFRARVSEETGSGMGSGRASRLLKNAREVEDLLGRYGFCR
jgi:hypothetical protein